MALSAMLGRHRLALVLCIISGTQAMAAPAGSAAQMITACHRGNDHNELRYAPSRWCSNSEDALTWNKQGVRGPTGAVGPAGATGPTGPRGVTGATGAAGAKADSDAAEKWHVVVVLEEIAALLKSSAAILLAAIAAFYLLMVVLVNVLVRVPRLKRWRLTRPLLRSLLRASLSIETLDDTALGGRVGPAVTGLMRSRCQYPRGHLGLDNVGGQAAVSSTMSAFKDFVGTNTTLAFVRYLYALWPRQRFILSGELQPCGPLGPGINLALYVKGLPDSVVTLWAGEYGIDVARDTAEETKSVGKETDSASKESMPGGGEMDAYARLATVAGAWVDYRLMEALGETPLSQRWRSWVFLRAGLDQHRLGHHDTARTLYEQALAHDGENAGALANLGILERRARHYDRAERLLRDAAKRLGSPPLLYRRRRGRGEVEVRIDSGDWFATRYQLAAMYMARSQSAENKTTDKLDAQTQARAIVSDGVDAVAVIKRNLRARKRRRTDACEELESFLHTMIVPSAIVLLAGTLLTERNRTQPSEPNMSLRGYRELRRILDAGEELNPWALIGLVESREVELAPRVYYNLACFYAYVTGGMPHARRLLEQAMLRTAVADREELLEVIKEDRTLRRVRNGTLMETLDKSLPKSQVKKADAPKKASSRTKKSKPAAGRAKAPRGSQPKRGQRQGKAASQG
jgi:tetratricopeptide (TPR) repeat protein